MRSVGNLATEDLVHFLNASGIDTGIATDDVVAAARDVGRMLDIEPRSFVVASGTRETIMEEARAHQRYHPD
jgi:hydroxymethylglutaryl-CoA lyase